MKEQDSGTHIKHLMPLVGDWKFKVLIETQPVVRGKAVFEWLENGAFLMQHTNADPPLPTTTPMWIENSPFPITTVIGRDDASGLYSYLYADGRGVRRVYQMRLSEGVWSIWGQAAPQFFQRFIGTFSKDNLRISACWERSADNTIWEHDFDMQYTKIK